MERKRRVRERESFGVRLSFNRLRKKSSKAYRVFEKYYLSRLFSGFRINAE